MGNGLEGEQIGNASDGHGLKIKGREGMQFLNRIIKKGLWRR